MSHHQSFGGTEFSETSAQAVTPGAAAPNVSYTAPRWNEPAKYSPRFYMAVAGFIVLALAAFVYLLPLLSVRGVGVTIFVAGLALLPVVVILAFIRWVDEWEPEPSWLFAVAFAWGAGVAALTSLIGNGVFAQTMATTAYLSEFQQEVLPIVVGAPLVEEAAKGVGVLVIYTVFRKYFNGPIDGLVYGMLVGLGFAFSENILYFSEYYDQLGAVFQARAIENPFIHPLATGLTGLFIGLASDRKGFASLVSLGFIGYCSGVLVHGLHNYSAVTAMSSSTRFAFQLPIYMAMLWIIWYLRGKERTDVSAVLAEYAAAGWLTHNELAMISKVSARRSAVDWAGKNLASLGGHEEDGRRAMERFQEEVIRLGYNRHRELRQGSVNNPSNRAEEMRQLQLISYLREVFTGRHIASVW